MKRILWIVAVVAALAGLGLWTMRFLGESRIEGRLDVARAKAEARGWALTWGTREAQGFPVANRVRLTDVALVAKSGVLIRIGEVVVAQDATAKNALAVRLPADIVVTVPIGGLARHTTPLLPPRLDVTIATEDALLRVGAGGGGGLTAILTAASLRAAVDQADFPLKMAIDAAAVALESDPAEDGRRFRLKAGTFGLDLRDLSGSGAAVVDSRYSDLAIGATVRADGLEAFAEALGKLSEKLLDGAFQSGSQIVTVSLMQGGAADGRPTTLTWTAGPQTGLFLIDKGTLGYSAEDRDVTATLDIPGASGSTALKASLLYYQRQFELPIVTAGEVPRPGSLRIAIEDFMPDEATWMAFDSAGRLAREPADLQIDTKATLRLTGGRGGAPVEFSNVSLVALRLAALGALAEAQGDIEILQPINLPLGEIKLALTGAGALIGNLNETGLIDDVMTEKARAILQVFARPAADADRHETEFAFTADGMLINGRTIDGRTPGAKPAITLDPPKPADDRPADTPAADGDTPAGGDAAGGDTPATGGDKPADAPAAGGAAPAAGAGTPGDAPADPDAGADAPADETGGGSAAPAGDGGPDAGATEPEKPATE